MKKIISVILMGLLASCATFKEQHTNESSDSPGKKIVHTIYLTGGGGNKPSTADQWVNAEEIFNKAPAESTLLFLGDNFASAKDTVTGDQLLQRQAAIFNNFQGNAYFIPGDNEWKGHDNSRLLQIEKRISGLTNTGKATMPKDGCPISSVAVNDNLEIIFIDSQWYISNWDVVKGINKKCQSIKTRRQFIEELENQIKDNQFKNIVIAMHHPVFSNGKHAGKYSMRDHMRPIPIVGTISKWVRKAGGTNTEDISSMRYRELITEVTTLAKLSDRITIVSGHESSLQLLEGGGIFQIISGTMSDQKETKLSKGSVSAVGGKLNYSGIYSGSTNGYSRLNFYDDGSSDVEFHSYKNDALLFRGKIMKPLPIFGNTKHEPDLKSFPPISQQQILPNEETKKSGGYRFLWGDHYRKEYSKPVTVKTALLDTLYGGLTILKEGGGHQSHSLRLQNINGKQYAMRSLKKDGMKFLRFKMKGIAFNTDSYENTAPVNLVNDFFTTAHPYAQLAISDIAEAASINHSDTKLYYFPKQAGFGDLNDEYGDALYFIEERPSMSQNNFEGYQFSSQKELPVKEFAGTNEVLEKIRSSKAYTIDQRQYIRSRIFDMLLGDWDRHSDQWRWVLRQTSKKGGVFSPIPRDRDGAFSKFDGVILAIVRHKIPETRFWQSYNSDLHNVKWFNSEAYNLDKIVLTQNNDAIWREEAQSIQKSLNQEIINRAFKKLPVEIQDEQTESIKSKFASRLQKLDRIAVSYAIFLEKQVVVYGTEKDDRIQAERLAGGKTKIEIFSKNADESEPYYSQTFEYSKTKEILVYGLNGDDQFTVTGKGKNPILLRMIGGYGSDSYTINNSVKTRVYDYNYEDNLFPAQKPAKKQLSRLYETNNLHYRYFAPNNNVIVPAFGYATDDGFFLGFKDIYSNKGFNGNPNKQTHKLAANYYFDFQSIEGIYQGEFANVLPKVNLFIDGYFTDPQFSNNFFGYGNETINPEDELGKDFNRARTRQVKLKTGLVYKTFSIAALFESMKVEPTANRFFTPENVGTNVFENQNYLGGELKFKYQNRDAEDFPTLGLYSEATAGWKTNLDISDNNFGWLSAKVGFDQKITNKGNLVFQTTFAGKIIIGNNYNFYDAATIGGNNGLRGFRDERFTGKSSFYDSSNLKLKIGKIKTGFLPVDFGIYGGFDWGRVWLQNDNSDKWHISQGGGLWVSGLSMVSLQAGYFNSVEGNFVFVGFNFKY